MGQVIGAFVAYKLIKQLALPWEEWDAYKLGLIDDKGKTLKKAKTKEEKNAMDYSLRLVKNVKKLIEKLPFGKTRLGTLAAALFLLKEDLGVENDTEFDVEMAKFINIPKNMISEEVRFPYLSFGTYVSETSGAMYHLQEDQEPYTVYLNVPLYKVVNLKTREYTIVSEQDIRRV